MKEELYNSMLTHFKTLTSIPRGNGMEKLSGDYIKSVADQNGLWTQTDEFGNVFVKKPASGICRDSKHTIILQSHLDMVCEKILGSTHDFSRDPLKLVEEDGWLKAEGTSLGADNGVGVAYMISIMDNKQLSHPNLELIFTAEEETTMAGARGFDKNLLSGTEMINLDSDDENEIIIGSAGGVQVRNEFLPNWEPIPENYLPIKVVIQGLCGGHSGEDINKGRKNGLILAARLLAKIVGHDWLRVGNISGGEASNSIMRALTLGIYLPQEKLESIKSIVDEYAVGLEGELVPEDKGLTVTIEQVESKPHYQYKHEKAAKVLSMESAQKLIGFINYLPFGVNSMDANFTDFVESSSNPGVCRTENDKIFIESELRSSSSTGLEEIKEKIKLASSVFRWTYEERFPYPGWVPRKKNELMNRAVKVYSKHYAKQPILKSIHAGLECGIFSEWNPDMEIISIGPTVKDYHSPDERVLLDSLKRNYGFLLDLLII